MIPELNHWSDVAFSIWSLLSGQFIQAPKHIVDMDVENGETLELIDYLLRWSYPTLSPNVGRHIYRSKDGLWQPMPWPGLTYQTSSVEGKMLLQTPLGKAAAMFLIQHKEAFGIKTIRSIQIFNCNPGVVLIFYVEDICTLEV